MGYSVYEYKGRWAGYGVPAVCDEPGCAAEIDRGLAYLCGGTPGGGERGCGLFFCSEHLGLGPEDDDPEMCARCRGGGPSIEPKPDTAEWIEHMLTDTSWRMWRDQHPERVDDLRASLSLKES